MAITEAHRDGIHTFFKRSYPSVTKHQIDKMLDDAVVLAEDRDPNTLYTCRAKVVEVNSLAEADEIIQRYLRKESRVFRRDDFIAPDF